MIARAVDVLHIRAVPPPDLSARFYAELASRERFDDVAESSSYAPLPNDWHVATCDVRNSTRAVLAGEYKHVNAIGAAAVTAVLNAAGGLDIPFIFEGDGSAFCVPPQLLDDVKAALLKTQEVASASFGLELRVAAIPVTHIRAAGFDIWVAKVRVSEHYLQAAFWGGGMAYADRCMKDPLTAATYEVRSDALPARGSHDGFECRWQDIPSKHGETVSVIVRALSADAGRAAETYRALIAKVREVYGTDEACHPLTPPIATLTPTLSARQLRSEVGVRAFGRGRVGQWLWLMRIRWFVALGWFLMRFGIRTSQTDWRGYKDAVLRNADVRKFSDIFRQVLSGTPQQRAALEAWLAERYARRELVYGLHVSDRALMTCLVLNYWGRHVHFIDGADGGFFLAAKQFKERAATLTTGG